MKLTDREWKEFFIGGKQGIFDLRASYSGIDKNKLLIEQEDIVPYITRTDINNGISGFVGKKQQTKYCIDDPNVITIGLDTQTVFYQPYKFYTGQNIQVLSNAFLNGKNALFIVQLLKIQLKKFNWGGNGATLGRLKKTKILLPSNSKGEPDYQFMEDYVKEIMHRKRQEYIDYVQKILAGGGKTEVIQSLMNKKWKAFKISDIFEIFAGKRLENKNQIIGNIPFIGATDSNNGITNFVSNKNTSFDNNVLGINYNGSVCEAFYHPYKCIFSDDVKRLHLKNSRNTENVLLFFSSIIKKQKEKYRYAYKFNTERMKKQYIMLPVDDKGNPDYEYMEYYTQNKMFAKYNDYLQYANNLE